MLWRVEICARRKSFHHQPGKTNELYQMHGGCSSAQSVNEFERLKLASFDLLVIASWEWLAVS